MQTVVCDEGGGGSWMWERPENPKNMTRDELMAEGWIHYPVLQSIFFFNSTICHVLERKKRSRIVGYLIIDGSIILPFKTDWNKLAQKWH